MPNTSKVPKYEKIAADLEKDLLNLKYSYGQQLPSETKLMEMYDVSRITARKALTDLETRGLIYKIQGKGCFASVSKKRQSLLQIHSYTQGIRDAGMVPGRRILSSQIRSTTLKETALLELPAESRVFQLDRLIYADEQVLCKTRAILPCRLFPKIEQFDFQSLSLYEIMEKEYQVKIYHMTLDLSPICADPALAAQMLLPENTPLIFTDSVSTTKLGNKEVPVELSYSYYNTDVIKYSVDKYN